MSFDINLIGSSLPLLAAGLGVTLKLLLTASSAGLGLALILLLMRLSGLWPLIWLAKSYIYFFRGTPILVQIFLIYYGLAQFELVRSSIFWPILRQPFFCCAVALSLNSAAYISEILRGGVLGVDRGILEAAKALGLRTHQRFLLVTTPIAVRLALPSYGNEIISMMKATALASTVTLLDITGVARTIVAATFAPFEIFIAVALIYLVMAWVFQTGLGLLEQRMNKHMKREA